MSAKLKAALTARLQRKAPGLPAFVVVPAKVVASWGLIATTVIEGTANGYPFGRRTIKAWGKGVDAWFVEFTGPICTAAGLRVGESVALELWLADASTPPELQVLLSGNKGLFVAWSGLTERERREASEYVRAAKNQTTRERRATAIASKLGGT